MNPSKFSSKHMRAAAAAAASTPRNEAACHKLMTMMSAIPLIPYQHQCYSSHVVYVQISFLLTFSSFKRENNVHFTIQQNHRKMDKKKSSLKIDMMSWVSLYYNTPPSSLCATTMKS